MKRALYLKKNGLFVCLLGWGGLTNKQALSLFKKEEGDESYWYAG